MKHMIQSILLAALVAATPALAQDASTPSEPCVSYAIQAFQGNTLVWESEVEAPVGQAVPVVISPEQAHGVGLVGYVWPLETKEGVETRYLLEGDWAPKATDAPVVEWHAQGTTNLALATRTNLRQQVSAQTTVDGVEYQLFLVQTHTP